MRKYYTIITIKQGNFSDEVFVETFCDKSINFDFTVEVNFQVLLFFFAVRERRNNWRVSEIVKFINNS